MYAVTIWLALAGFCLAQAPKPPVIPDSVFIQTNIQYDQYKETVLDVLQPKVPSRGKRPGVLAFHGGGHTGGSKEMVIEPMCLRYVEKGFVCVAVGYRLAKTAQAPAAVTDSLKAAEWFFKNADKYNVDRKRIVVTGGSAGGHLALMVGMTPKSAGLGPPAHVRAVVNFCGSTDLASMQRDRDKPDLQRERDKRQAEKRKAGMGGDTSKPRVTWLPLDQPGWRELAIKVSPVTYVRKDLPPILTIHGDEDPAVPYVQAVKLTKALRDAGADTELVTVPHGKHGNYVNPSTDEIYALNIWPFLKRHGILH